MGNSPTDKSKNFIESGMTLITDPAADKLLNKVKQAKNKKNERAAKSWTPTVYSPSLTPWRAF